MASRTFALMALFVIAALLGIAPAASQAGVDCSTVIKSGRLYTLTANTKYVFTAAVVRTWPCPEGTCLFIKLTGADATASDSMTGYFAGSGVALTRSNGNPVTPGQVYSGVCFTTGVSGQFLSLFATSSAPLTTPYPWNMSLPLTTGR